MSNKMTARKSSFVLKELKCEECENIQIIPRKKNRNRSYGHIKHIWCHICKKTIPHKEIGQIY